MNGPVSIAMLVYQININGFMFLGNCDGKCVSALVILWFFKHEIVGYVGLSGVNVPDQSDNYVD